MGLKTFSGFYLSLVTEFLVVVSIVDETIFFDFEDVLTTSVWFDFQHGFLLVFSLMENGNWNASGQIKLWIRCVYNIDRRRRKCDSGPVPSTSWCTVKASRLLIHFIAGCSCNGWITVSLARNRINCFSRVNAWPIILVSAVHIALHRA